MAPLKIYIYCHMTLYVTFVPST